MSSNVPSDTAASRGAIPSPWILNLPCILRAPIIFLYVDILDADDDFQAQLRKLVFTVCAFLAPCPISSTVYNWLTISDWIAAAAVARFCALLMPITWIGVYLAARLCPKMSTALLAAIFVYCTWISLFLVATSYIDWPAYESMVLLAIGALLLRVPGLPFALALCAVGHITASNNSAAFARGEPEVALWAFPGAVMRGYASRMLQNVVSFCSAVLVLAALQLQLLESDKQTRQAQASTALALEIATLLGDYDTESAGELLEEARNEESDPNLIEALEVLVDNLNKYRPHLPNWLLPKTASTIRLSRGGDHESAAAITTGDDEDSRSVRSEGANSVRSRTSSRDKSAVAPVAPLAAAEWLRGGDPFESFVSVAQVRFVTRWQQSTSAINHTSFVDTVHRLAGQTAAAVHCFVGDTVVLTWNAASRAVQSEAKAARMVARLMTYAAEAGVRVHGAVVSGKARVQLAGSEGQQKALTVSSELLGGRLSAVAAVGQRLGCIACDYATRSSAGHTVVLQPAGATLLPPPAPDGAHAVAMAAGSPGARVASFKICSELHDDAVADEWMYVLQSQEGAAGHDMAKYMGLLDAWAKGDDQAVSVMLEHISEGSQSATPPGQAADVPQDEVNSKQTLLLNNAVDRALQKLHLPRAG